MRILFLNAWGGRMHAPLIAFLKETNPDILCLQEVTRTFGFPLPWLTYRDCETTLPQRANLFSEVSAILTEHAATFAPTARGTLFDGDMPVLSEFGLATFVRNTFPVIGQALGFMHGAFSTDGWGPHPRARNAHCVRLFDYGGGFPVTIAQMHGLRDPGGKADTPARVAQAQSLVGLIRQVWRPGEQLVVCGDFNVLPGSVTFAQLSELGLIDLVTTRGFTDTRTSHYAKTGRYADYLLVTPNVEIVHFDVVAEPEVSDHRALAIEIR